MSVSTRKCVVRGCNSRGPGQKVGFFRLPKQKKYRQCWIDFITKNQCWDEDSAIDSTTHVCSKHFEPNAIHNLSQYRMGFAKRLDLVEGAVPSILPSIVPLFRQTHVGSGSSSAMTHSRKDIQPVKTPEKPVRRTHEAMLNHNCLALLHHDYIRTMTKSLKNYILSRQIPSESPTSPFESRKTAKVENSCEAPPAKRELVELRVSKRGSRRKRKRKHKSLLMYGGKTKLERNPGYNKTSLSKKSRNEFPPKVPTTDACTDASEQTTPKNNKSLPSDNRKSGSSSLKKPKRRRHLTLYRGKTKLERNPHVRYRKMREKQLLDRIIKVEPIDGVKSMAYAKLTGSNKEHSQSYEKHVLKSLYTMQKRGTLCDLTIIVGSPRTLRQFPIHVHKLIFSSVSTKLKWHKEDVFDASRHLTKLDAPKIIEFVYTGGIEDIESVAQDEIQRLHTAAVFLEIPKCISYLESHKRAENICASNHEATKVPPLLFDLPPLPNVAQYVEEDAFDLSDIRIESVVSQSIDTTDTSSDEDPR